MQSDPGLTLISPTLPHFFYGGDYNPEQWPEEIWPEDVRLMGEAGVNLVTLGVFSWSRLEPRPSEFDWGWLDRIMDLLHESGVRVDLATATASPPPWLARLHPDSLPVTRDGTTLWPGSRQQYCPSNPAFREGIQNLVRNLAERYAQHPALAMWHIGNEYACHVAECFCEVSAAHFRRWLQARYGTIESLNAAWGTAFWSQHYAEWDEINPPRTTPTFLNPTHQLDWRRFSSDAILECFELERAILKELQPDVPITTNFMGFFKPLDYWKWAARQDVISDDSYPDPSDPNEPRAAAMSYDLMRSLGGGRPWVLMEQTTAQVNWRRRNSLKQPGQMRSVSYQAVSRGANGVMFFQWRASQAGSEKFHSGMVPHVGTDNSRVWREVTALGSELARLDALLLTKVKASVAIMLDWPSWWALELETHPSSDIRQMEQVASYYRALYGRNLAVDFVSPQSDLTSYELVLVPNLYSVADADATRLESYVRDGGTVVMSFFSGIVDEHDHIRLGGYPAPFRSMLGLRVEEFEPLQPAQSNRLVLTDGQVFDCDLWADFLDLEGAEALASFGASYFEGRPAITRHAFGKGGAYYLATRPDDAFMNWLTDRLIHELSLPLPPVSNVPSGVEIVRRSNADHAYLFIINQNSSPAHLTLQQPGHDLLTGQTPNPPTTRPRPPHRPNLHGRSHAGRLRRTDTRRSLNQFLKPVTTKCPDRSAVRAF